MVPQKHIEPSVRPDTLTIPELEQSKAAVLNTRASVFIPVGIPGTKSRLLSTSWISGGFFR
jgi:hypothetical protein